MRQEANTTKNTTERKQNGTSQTSCSKKVGYPDNRGRSVISAASLRNMPVYDCDNRSLGKLKDLMIETDRGTVAYAVLLFEDNKTFALPFSALKIDHEDGAIYVDIRYEVFEAGSGMSTAHRDNN